MEDRDAGAAAVGVRTTATSRPSARSSCCRSENERLTGQIRRLEERIAVLERIATDPAERTAREIEALR